MELQAYQIAELIEEYVEEQLKAAVAVSENPPGLSKLRRISSSRSVLSRQNTSSTLLAEPGACPGARRQPLISANSEPSTLLLLTIGEQGSAVGAYADGARQPTKRCSLDMASLQSAAAAPAVPEAPRTNSLGSASSSASADQQTRHKQSLVAQLRSSLAAAVVTKSGGESGVRTCIAVSLQPGLSPVSAGDSCCTCSEVVTPVSAHASRTALNCISPPPPQRTTASGATVSPPQPQSNNATSASASATAPSACKYSTQSSLPSPAPVGSESGPLACETDTSQDSGRGTLNASVGVCSGGEQRAPPRLQQQHSSAGSVSSAATRAPPLDPLLDNKCALNVQLHDCEFDEML